MPLIGNRLVCDVCQVNSIETPPGATEKTKYKCGGCNGAQPAEQAASLRFDRHQFGLLRAHDFEAANGDRSIICGVDGNGMSMTFSQQCKPRADAPAWVFDDDMIQRVSARHSQSRQMTARRTAALYLYYRCSWGHKEIGEMLEITEAAVSKLLQRLAERGDRLAT